MWTCRGFSIDPSVPNIQGTFLPSTGVVYGNAGKAYPFDNEFATGMFLPTHRPTFDKAMDRSGDWAYGDHYRSRKRVWEMRMQFKFKKPVPRRKLLFGIELEEYVPVDAGSRRVMDTTVRMMRSVVGNELYHSVGDDPAVVTGELERPVFMMPLWAFDQFIETPAGEDPPDLSDPEFSEMGCLRSQSKSQFCKIINELDLDNETTYTFAFWGISHFLDVINWEVQKVVPLMSINFNSFCGKPPVYLVLYTLGEPASPGEERHLQSRKSYYFRLPFWSSIKPPSQDVIDSLLMTGRKAPKPITTTPANKSCREEDEESSDSSNRAQSKKPLSRAACGLNCCSPRFPQARIPGARSGAMALPPAGAASGR